MDQQLTLTEEIEINDEIDRRLLEEILLTVQNTQVLSLVSFWGHQKLQIDKADEQFLKHIMLSINALVKANALRRNYVQRKDDLIEEIKKDKSISGTNIDMLFNKVDAFILIEAFFGQIKTSLDLLAQSLKPIYGREFQTWKRKNNLSGMAIADTLSTSIKDDIKPNAKPIIELIKHHSKSITQIVAHRDDTVHYGKLKNVQGFRYSVKTKEIIPPLIKITETEAGYVDEYMMEVLKYIADFVQAFIITLLSNLLPDMKVAKHKDGQWGWVSGKGGEINGVFEYTKPDPPKA